MAIETKLLQACARATATGVFKSGEGGTTSEPVTTMIFRDTVQSLSFTGLRFSDDGEGVDLVAGGSGQLPYATFESYIVAAQNLDIDTLALGPDGTSVINAYAVASVTQALEVDQRYTVEWRVDFADGGTDEVQARHLGAVARALATGLYRYSTGGTSEHINECAFVYTLSGTQYGRGRRPSDDAFGVDLYDGGDGVDVFAEWQSYWTNNTGDQIEVARVELGRSWLTAPEDGTLVHAKKLRGQVLEDGQKYTVSFKWDFSAE
jgi:hypothetical protein